MSHSGTDATGSRIGMWLFLYTEIMLFGGLFILYAAYYYRYTAEFIAAGADLDVVFGTANTVILLVSSFAVAAAVTAAGRGDRKKVMGLLAAAIALGAVFLVNKYFEWGHKIHAGIFPGSELLAKGPGGRNLFFGLYYLITGLHGLHIVVGMTLLAVALAAAARGRIRPGRIVLLENVGLYWHLVDLIWIFIFPLFYLIL